VRFVSTLSRVSLKALKAFKIEFARKFLSARIHWVYLGISEFGKAFSQNGNGREGMISVSNIRAHSGRKNGLTEVQYGKEAHGIFTVIFSYQ
jgi:hypothetical protein